MNFRYDINGLRAIAVIAVVLFHFNPAWVPGGFAGVDVFFVISGFLMTGIIFRGLESNSFNLFKFYVARANRIIPALAVLCLVLLVFGWSYLTPLDYKALAKHVASSMGFLSNVIYWRESGYFDATSHEKWLLHTWSLSVEWQFYIIYPIVLVALKKFLSLESLKRLIVVGSILGFCLSVIATMKWPNPAYYLLPTRAWEMMIGGVAFLYPWNLSESRKRAVEFIGLALILGSYVFVSSDVPWPGHFALLPVFGAYLIIVSNQQSSLITNNVFFQYLGRWSYSIYLWHWPIVVYGYYFDVQGWALYGLPLSVILGFVSFQFVEGFKFKCFSQWSDFFRVKALIFSALLVSVSLSVFSLNGLKSRFPERAEYVSDMMKDIEFPSRSNGYCFYSGKESDYPDKDIGVECNLNDSDGKKLLLFGSSYAGMYEPFWKAFAEDNGWSVNSITSSWCAPYLNESFTTNKIHTPEYKQCMYNREFVKDNIGSYDAVVLAGLWAVRYKSKTIDSIKETIELALSKDVKVLIMASPVSYKKEQISMFERYLWSGRDYKHLKNNDLYNKQANDYVSSISIELGSYFIGRELLFTDGDFYLKNGLEVPYSLDGGHISKEGALKAYDFMVSNDNDHEIISYINN